MKILIVEDDDRLAAALSAFLAKTGYLPVRVATGMAAMEQLDAETELILLDLGLPDIDGIDLCRRIRARSSAPIIMATARSQIEERIRGLRVGADDFVVKPYDVRELIARIEAITRRSRPLAVEAPELLLIEAFDVQIDLVSRRVLVDDVAIELTRKEFDIIAVLARYPGVALARERIIREVWNTDWHGYNHSLDVHIAALRKKLGKGALIETVRGVGYRLAGQ